MIDLWQLPRQALIGGKTYGIHTDFRDILEIFTYLQDPDLPEFLKWHIALGLFYDRPIPDEAFTEAAEYFCRFVNCGAPEEKEVRPQLIDWQHDAQDIISDVNKVAGQEIRQLPFLHWWTFLGWFHGIGEGQLSSLVTIRDKLRRGKKLEGWEQDYYRNNRSRVQLPARYSRDELEARSRLQKLLA